MKRSCPPLVLGRADPAHLPHESKSVKRDDVPPHMHVSSSGIDLSSQSFSCTPTLQQAPSLQEVPGTQESQQHIQQMNTSRFDMSEAEPEYPASQASSHQHHCEQFEPEDEDMRETRLAEEAAKTNLEVASESKAHLPSTFDGQGPTSAEVTGAAVIPGTPS